jgi:hypothetical protein
MTSWQMRRKFGKGGVVSAYPKFLVISWFSGLKGLHTALAGYGTLRVLAAKTMRGCFRTGRGCNDSLLTSLHSPMASNESLQPKQWQLSPFVVHSAVQQETHLIQTKAESTPNLTRSSHCLSSLLFQLRNKYGINKDFIRIYSVLIPFLSWGNE